MEIYCVTCKEKTDTKSPKKFTMKNGMSAVRGICSDCGGKVCVITGKSDKSVTRNSSEKSAKPAKSENKEVKRNSPKSGHQFTYDLAKKALSMHEDPEGIAFLKGVMYASDLAAHNLLPTKSGLLVATVHREYDHSGKH